MFPKTIRAALFLAITFAATHAMALPSIGGLVPDTRAYDADGRTLDMRALVGRPALVVYEDKSSATQNTELKNELSRLAQGERYRRAIALVPVADVADYSFWPIKGFVKDSIRSESEKVGATIYCDWDGSFRSAFGFRRGMSNIVLVGRGGAILFAREGTLSAEERAKLIELLRGEVAKIAP